MSRVHLRIELARPHISDPKRAFERLEAFVFELNNTLDGVLIHRTAEHMDIAVPPSHEKAARELAARYNDPDVIVVPRLVERVLARSAS